MDFPRPYSLTEIADLVKGKVLVDGTGDVLGMNELHIVRPGDISFVDHPKYYQKALNSDATFVIINKKVEAPAGKGLIFHNNPFDAFNKLSLYFRPFKKCDHAISTSANIGEGTILQPGVFIGNNVTIGKNCLIHAHVSIYDNTVIGNNVIIHSNSVIGSDGYYFQKRENGYEKFQSVGRVILDSNVEIGASCSIDRGVTGDTFIGEGTKMDNQCQVGHDTIIGKYCLIGAFAAIAGVTVIEDDVVLWARVAINKDIVVGKGTVLLATSAIDKSVEGGKILMGSPAIEVRQYWKNYVAMRQLPELLKKIK